jgi:hypothetical protein
VCSLILTSLTQSCYLYVFSIINLLVLVRTVTFSFSTLQSLCMVLLYFGQNSKTPLSFGNLFRLLVPTKWNVSRGSSQLFVTVVSSPVSITVYANALQYLNPIQYVRGGKNLKHCSLLKFILVLNSVFPSWKLLDFVSVLGVSGSLVAQRV